MRLTQRTIRLAIPFLATTACTSAPNAETIAPPAEPVAVVGFYSEPQAARGREMFGSFCSECHDTGDFRGPDFEWAWRRQTAWDLYETMAETMPEDAPGSLSPETYAAVIAYILLINEYPAGTRELVPEQGSMDSVPLGPDVDKNGRSGSTGT